MAFNEIDLKRIEKAASEFLALRRPPPHVRAQVDLEYTIHNQTVELLEVRPRWNKPNEIARRPFAKATFVRTENEWRIYWMRGNLKWHAYDPPSAATVAQFFELVNEDRYGCFLANSTQASAISLTSWSSRRQQLRCWCPPLRSGAAYRER